MRERLYGLVSPDTDGLVTADQVVERVANTKAVGYGYSDLKFNYCGSRVQYWTVVRKCGRSGCHDFNPDIAYLNYCPDGWVGHFASAILMRGIVCRSPIIKTT